MLILTGCGTLAHAVPSRSGEAMVAGQIGDAWVRVFSSAVHYGQTEVHPLFEGAIVGETARVGTGRNGQLLMVLDHGGMISLAGRTEVTLHHIGVSANGLPRQASDITGRIELELHGGSLSVTLADTAVPVVLTVKTSDGVVSAGPGEFLITTDQQRGARITSRSGQQMVMRRDGSQLTVNAGHAVSVRDPGLDLPVPMQMAMIRSHQMWRNVAAKSNSEVAANATINKSALAAQLGFSPKSIVQTTAVLSVSPVDPPPPDPEPEPVPALPDPEPEPVPALPDPPEVTNRPDIPENDPPGPGMGPGVGPAPESDQEETIAEWKQNLGASQRSAEVMLRWYNNVAEIKGVNFWTSNVENPADMWKPENFNLDLIREDFRLAKDTGYTDIRVQLNIDVWLNDPEGFFGLLTQFINEAISADLRLVPVLLDPVALNKALAKGMIAPTDVENFIKSTMNNFKDSKDILYWDLFEMVGIGNISADARDLLIEAAKWARQIDASQPVTIAAIPENGQRVLSADPGTSDLLTFSSTDPPEKIREIIQELLKNGRPVICTDWLDRENRNGFAEILPIFAEYKVGWFNRGLRSDSSDGNTRTHVFDQDGNPIDKRDIELIQAFTFGEGQLFRSSESDPSTEE